MGEGRKIIGLRAQEPAEANTSEARDVPEPVFESAPDPGREHTGAQGLPWLVEEPEPARRGLSPAAILMSLLALAWTGFYGWSQWPILRARPLPAEWPALVGDWAVPMALIGLTYLLFLRTSRRESERYTAGAAALRVESHALEQRLRTMNSELTIAREFLLNQSRELETLGRTASDRLQGHAERMGDMIADNGTELDKIERVSQVALENMDRLRGHLPVIATSAKDVTNQIANAGRTAQSQIGDMVEGFKRINDFGQAADRLVTQLGERVAGEFDTLEQRGVTIAGALQSQLIAFGQGSDAQMAQIRDRVLAEFSALEQRSTAITAMVEVHLAELGQGSDHQISQLRDRISREFDALEQRSGAITAMVDAQLSELGQSSDAHVSSLTERVAHELGTLESRSAAMAAEMAERLDALDERAETARVRLGEAMASLSLDINALVGNTRTRSIEAQDELASRGVIIERELLARFERLASTAQFSTETLGTQLAQWDERLASLSQTREIEDAALRAMTGALAAQIGEVRGQVDRIQQDSSSHAAELAFALAAVRTNIDELTPAMARGQSALDRLNDDSAALARHVDDQAGALETRLPASMEQVAALLDARTREIEALLASTEALDDTAQQLTDRITAINDALASGKAAIEGQAADLAAIADFSTEFADKQDARQAFMLDGLRATRAEAEGLAEAVEGDLSNRLAAFNDQGRHSILQTREALAATVASLSETLTSESDAAIERVLRSKAAELIGRMEAAMDRASGASYESAVHLRDQLVKIDELAGNLERRVAQARERSLEQTDNSFARRVALITEALNSHAIDITKTLASDVTDTAWAAYLKGDRGIFTRRAVRLLDSGEVREVVRHYEADSEFRDNVNRYIHDFESMLRDMLSTRDGNALGVTLLSSDMGKLYVALAQAIERFRT